MTQPPKINQVVIGMRVMSSPVLGVTFGKKPYVTFVGVRVSVFTSARMERVSKTTRINVMMTNPKVVLREGDCVQVQGSIEQQQRSEGPGNPGDLYIYARDIEVVSVDGVDDVPGAVEREYAPAVAAP